MNKQELYAKLRANTHQQYDMSEMNIEGIHYDDVLAKFIETTKNVGGDVIIAQPGEQLDDIIRRRYPEAEVLASNLPEVTIANKNPDEVKDAQDLNGTDVGIVRGDIGVAENGCIWIPQRMREKAVLFISEYLVIVLKKNNIVHNMHEAYSRIEMTGYNFGTFISGPSKTADIEQSLVMGAQAARGVTVILV